MTFLICAVPVCPVRAAAAHRSEQTTQLLFGEICQLLEELNDFVRIRVLYDNYEGWCQASQLEGLNKNEWFFENKLMAGEWLNTIFVDDKPMYIPFGSSLDFLGGGEGFIGKRKIKYAGSVIEVTKNKDAETLEKTISVFLNTSYLWGGKSVFGIDCSGFTQLVFKCLGTQLLRDASQQATQGETINSLEKSTVGDLAFFNNEAGKITHVGILLSSKSIIHSSGKVRIDTIKSEGIIHNETGKQTHVLNSIKRI